jgi:8-oxo-dGTP pyrophosphatase MutT (NUDIX family)
MSSKNARSVGIQYAALPFRVEAGQLRILLITSRATRRWVIPKGWPMNGLKPNEAAAVEAAEEAGVIGEIEDAPIGAYRYMKALKDDQQLDVQVIVFPMRVVGFAEDWKERGQRRSEWFSYQRAAALVAEPALRHLIHDFGLGRAPGLLAHGRRVYRAWRAGTRG